MTGIMAFITVLLVMPLAHACTMLAFRLPPGGQVAVIIACVTAATVIMYVIKFMRSSSWSTFLGLIAGTLLWGGLVEIGAKMGSQRIGVEEMKFMELTLAIIIPLSLYLLFNENIRCNFSYRTTQKPAYLKGAGA